MSIEVRCANCQKIMKVKDSLAGTRGGCPYCGGEINVPASAIPVSIAAVDRLSAPQFIPTPTATPMQAVAPVAPPPLPTHQTGEQTVYSDRDVTVTTARVICGGTTYALRNITSVKMAHTPANTNAAAAIMSLGAIMLSFGVSLLRGNLGGTFLFLIIGIPLLVVGWRQRKQAKPDYHLAMASSSGEVQAFTSKDREQVTSIVAAVNEAIVRYR